MTGGVSNNVNNNFMEDDLEDFEVPANPFLSNVNKNNINNTLKNNINKTPKQMLS